MKREDQLEVFSLFREAIKEFLALDAPHYKHKRSTTSHRLANILAKHFPSSNTEIDADGADIIVERENIVLALFWHERYLASAKWKSALLYHNKRKPLLTLGLSLLPKKDFILIYRFEDNFVEYMHIDKENFNERKTKSVALEKKDEKQLYLSLGRKRKKS